MPHTTLEFLTPSPDYVDPHPAAFQAAEAGFDVHEEPGAVLAAMAAVNMTALAGDMLGQARRTRALAAARLHYEQGWPFRKIAKLLHVSEAGVRAMITKHEDGKGAAE